MSEPFVAERPLLKYVPRYQQGPTFNRFLEPVRRGMTTDPDVIVRYVVERLKEDFQHRGTWNFASDLTPLRETLLAIVGHPTEARALAQEAIAYESMSPEEKAERKATRAEKGRRAWMRTQPATQKQLKYLEGLGVTKIPANRQEASEWSDTALRGAR